MADLADLGNGNSEVIEVVLYLSDQEHVNEDEIETQEAESVYISEE